MTTTEEFKRNKRDCIYLICVGPIALVVAIIAYIVFVAVETGELETVSVPRVAYLLYTAFGALGTSIIFTLLGALCSVWGVYKYQKLKTDNR